jgi:hypothetical protein
MVYRQSSGTCTMRLYTISDQFFRQNFVLKISQTGDLPGSSAQEALHGNNLHLLLFERAGIGVVKIIHWEYEVPVG